MKKIILAAVMLIVINSILTAQKKVTIGILSTDTTALLEVNANNKGMLVPRLTNAQMIAISPSPANGLLIYNTDSAAFAYRTASAWVFLKGNTTASSGWSTTGNAGTNTDKNFIGTTDNTDLIFKRDNKRAALINDSLDNTSWGAGALANNSNATLLSSYSRHNTAVGSKALFGNTTGFHNTAVGPYTLSDNDIGAHNTAIGSQAMYRNTSGSINTALGEKALLSNTTGERNVAAGYGAMQLNKSATGNVAIGTVALYFNARKRGLVAIGDSALFHNGPGTPAISEAEDNTAVGNQSMVANTTGYRNAAFGNLGLYNNITGNYNTAIGNGSLYANISGSGNTGTGGDALGLHQTGDYNTAMGSGSLFSNVSGQSNTSLGYQAGYQNATGGNNVFIGNQAGYNETGSNKLYISNSAANANNALMYGEFDNKLLRVNGKLEIKTTAGNTGIDLSSSDAYAEMRVIRNTLNGSDKDIYLGFGSPATSAVKLFSGGFTPVAIIKDNEVGIGKVPLTANSDSRLQVKQKGNQNGIGVEAENSTNHWDFFVTSTTASDFSLYYNGSLKGSFNNVTGAYTAPSDRRLKKDITAQMPVLKNVLQLQAYQYHYLDNQPTDHLSNGFMAQDVQKLFPDAVVENTMKDGQTRLGINYQYFTVVAIKGLQEQQKEMEEMKAQMKMMVDEIEKLKTK